MRDLNGKPSLSHLAMDVQLGKQMNPEVAITKMCDKLELCNQVIIDLQRD